MEIEIVNDNTEAVLKELAARKKEALEAIGRKAEKYAKARAPVDTGRLRASIKYGIDGEEVYLDSDVEYMIYQELGTRHIAAKHFMRDAMTQHVSEYGNMIENALKR